MSWGGDESSNETTTDSTFTTPIGHPGVTFLASTGDSGSPGMYPAYSPNVVAVGGTTLHVSSSGTYESETAWSDSGGGVSSYEPAPAFQAGLGYGGRATPDVAYDADPNTGIYVYDSYIGGWYVFGGTSAGSPQWAGLIALVDQGRAAEGAGPLNGATQLLPALYSLSSADFHDITTGSAGGNSAKPGYDLVTGLGSPVANRLIPDLVTVDSSNTASPPPATWQSLGEPVLQVVAANDANGDLRLFAIGSDHAV
jgi:subtilase family serine protease